MLVLLLVAEKYWQLKLHIYSPSLPACLTQPACHVCGRYQCSCFDVVDFL
jgi:hypothetical protein